MDNAALDKLIRESLKQPYDWPIPDHYRKPYVLHMVEFPEEKSFFVEIPQPKMAKLVCFKGECYDTIPLTWDAGAGLFNLTNYRDHLRTPDAIRKHALVRNPSNSTTPTQPDPKEDIKPDVSATSPSSKRPLATSPPLNDADKKPKLHDVTATSTPDFTEQKLELSNLDLKQARTESQISQLKANTPAFSRGDNYNAQLNYYETILKNVARERAQLEAIIQGTKPVLDLAEDEVDESNQQTHVATSAAADAGSAPRTLETQAAAVDTGDDDASNGGGNGEGCAASTSSSHNRTHKPAPVVLTAAQKRKVASLEKQIAPLKTQKDKFSNKYWAKRRELEGVQAQRDALVDRSSTEP